MIKAEKRADKANAKRSDKPSRTLLWIAGVLLLGVACYTLFVLPNRSELKKGGTSTATEHGSRYDPTGAEVTQLFVTRHGEGHHQPLGLGLLRTAWAGMGWGWRNRNVTEYNCDMLLTTKGVEQCHVAAVKQDLAHVSNHEIRSGNAVLVSSPISRALQTMWIATKKFRERAQDCDVEVSVVMVPGLREYQNKTASAYPGCWMDLESLKERHAIALQECDPSLGYREAVRIVQSFDYSKVEAHLKSNPDPYGWKSKMAHGSEDLDHFKRTVETAVCVLRSPTLLGKKVFVFCHGGTMRMLRTVLCRDQYQKFHVENCETHRYVLGRSGNLVTVRGQQREHPDESIQFLRNRDGHSVAQVYVTQEGSSKWIYAILAVLTVAAALLLYIDYNKRSTTGQKKDPNAAAMV